MKRRLEFAAPVEIRVDHHAFRNERRAVALVERQIGALGADRVAEDGGIPLKRADMRARVRIEQQLVAVEAMARLRLVGAVDAQTIERSRSDVGDSPVKDFIGEFRQFEAFALAFAVAVENADLDPRRIGGKDRKIHARPVPGRPERKRLAFAEAG